MPVRLFAMAAVIVPLAHRNMELMEQILLELEKVPEERYPEVYRRLRQLAGRKARPGTGPLTQMPQETPHLDED